MRVAALGDCALVSEVETGLFAWIYVKGVSSQDTESATLLHGKLTLLPLQLLWAACFCCFLFLINDVVSELTLALPVLQKALNWL